jgi:hypothetical protein
LQFDAEVEEGEGWEDAEAETDAPGGSHVVFAAGYDLDIVVNWKEMRIRQYTRKGAGEIVSGKERQYIRR